MRKWGGKIGEKAVDFFGWRVYNENILRREIKVMKKFRFVTSILLLVCLVALSACGGNTLVDEKFKEAQTLIVQALGLEDDSTMKVVSAEYVEITGDGLFDAMGGIGCIYFKIRVSVPGDGGEIYSYHYPYYDANKDTIVYSESERDFDYWYRYVKVGNVEGKIATIN